MVDQVSNFTKVTVSTTYDASATSIALSSGHGALLPDPASGNYNLVWWNVTDYPDPSDDPNVEIVRVTAKSSDTITVTRAQETTSASTKNTSGKTYKMLLALTAKMITDLAAAAAAAAVALKGITLSGSGTSWTAASTPTGTFSFVVDTNSGQFLGYQGGNYTVSGTTVTFTSAVPTGYNSLVLICVG